ncbi:MAG: cytochrome c [SAR324 cluster bacterium]|nr:cytochrome c [SAR324 cluster bacterium]
MKVIPFLSVLFLIVFLSHAVVQAEESVSVTTRNSIIQYRKIFMDAKGLHTQAIKLLVSKKIGLYSQIVTHADALNKMAEDMLHLFPPGSQGADSRTLPTIWNKDGTLSQTFVEQAQIMKQEAKKMAEVAKTQDMDLIKKQLREFATNGCRGCHSLFRGEDSEWESM